MSLEYTFYFENAYMWFHEDITLYLYSKMKKQNGFFCDVKRLSGHNV